MRSDLPDDQKRTIIVTLIEERELAVYNLTVDWVIAEAEEILRRSS
jgi:hypothetical protein